MCAVWDLGDSPLIGIADLGSDEDERIDRVLEVLEEYDGTVVGGDVEDVLESDPSVIVARGERSLSAIVRGGVECPVIPTGSVPGFDPTDPGELSTVVRSALEGTATIRDRSILEVGIEFDDGDDRSSSERAAFDATLVTAEPARISEFSVRRRGEEIAQFRADGVVVATPAGTRGYASTIGAPQLSRSVDAVAVAPIAPFVTRTRHWVVPPTDLVLAVERDEGEVALVVDGHPVETLSVGSRVTISRAGTLPVVVPNS